MPDAKPVYINSSADLIAALEAGKIDGFAVDEPAARQFCAQNPRLSVVDEYLDTFSFGIVLPKTEKGDALLETLNAWLTPMNSAVPDPTSTYLFFSTASFKAVTVPAVFRWKRPFVSRPADGKMENLSDPLWIEILYPKCLEIAAWIFISAEHCLI